MKERAKWLEITAAIVALATFLGAILAALGAPFHHDSEVLVILLLALVIFLGLVVFRHPRKGHPFASLLDQMPIFVDDPARGLLARIVQCA